MPMNKMEPVSTLEMTKKNGRSKIIVNKSRGTGRAAMPTIVTVVTGGGFGPLLVHVHIAFLFPPR